MKILLFGEFSGFFNNLKDGLQILGHEVFLASNGDFYKNCPSDFRWDSKIQGKIGIALGYLNLFSHLKKFIGFDIVQVISPNPLFNYYLSGIILDFLIKNNGKVFISGAGLNAYSFDYWHNNIDSKYYNYTLGDLEEAKKNKITFKNINNIALKNFELRIFKKIQGYIPIMYEYAEPYRNFSFCLKTVPIPINIRAFTYAPNNYKNKIVFFHGLTRASKGGDFIIKAFNLLEKKYSKVAVFICKGGLPYKDYIELLKQTNVVLDDVNAYSLGMNSLFSMAQGKIVMGGAEPVAIKELGYSYCPAINLIRNVDQIVESIESVLSNKQCIEELGFKSRLFVETYHDHIKVATEYVNLWNQRSNLIIG